MPISQLGEWMGVLLLVASPGVIAAVLWSPFLLVTRLRELFRQLPFSGSFLVNYLLVMVGFSLPWVLGTGYVFARTPTEDVLLANALLDVVFPLGVLYLVGLPVIAIVGLPRLGIRWLPREAPLTTWLVLVLGTAWYTLVFAGPLFVLSLIFALPT